MPEARFPTIGDTFADRYQIEAVIGAGGFSRVYRASQLGLRRNVAIKILKPVADPTDAPGDTDRRTQRLIRRFEREAKLISQLKDRNTVMMFEYGETDGMLFMVLEYVDGHTLGDLIAMTGQVPPARVVKILRQALRSLQEAHALGVLHRDIKPGNIMVFNHAGERDLVKVLDFGIAKTLGTQVDLDGGSADVTADGVLVGTPRYMSPEQIRGHELAAASDIYSLGLVCFELLMGTKAVGGNTSMSIIARHLDIDPILLPDDALVPPRLRECVNRMLIKDPDARFQSCREVLEALESWDEPIATRRVDEPTVDFHHDTIVDEEDPREEPKRPMSFPTRGPAVGIVMLFLVLGWAAVVFLMPGPERDPLAEGVDWSPDQEVAAQEAVAPTEPEPEPEPPAEPVEPVEVPAFGEASRIAWTANVAASNAAEALASVQADKAAKVKVKRRTRRSVEKTKKPKKGTLNTVDLQNF